MGWPNRVSRLALGGTFKNKRPVRNPLQEVADAFFNLVAWMVSGSSQTADVAWALVSVPTGGPAALAAHGESWNPNQDGGVASAPTPLWVATGHVRLTYPSPVLDDAGASVALNLQAAKPFPQTASDIRATAIVSGGNVVDVHIWDAGGAPVDCDVLVEAK